MTMHLDQLRANESATILSVAGSGHLRQRLSSLGFTPGTRVTVRKFAPLGDPMEIRIRHYSLSIRKRDARSVLVQPVETRSGESWPGQLQLADSLPADPKL